MLDSIKNVAKRARGIISSPQESGGLNLEGISPKKARQLLPELIKIAEAEEDAANLLMSMIREISTEQTEKTARSFWRYLTTNSERFSGNLFSKIGTQVLDHMKGETNDRRVHKSLMQLWELLDPEERIRMRSKTEVIVPIDYAAKNISIHCDSVFEFHTRAHAAAKEPELVEWIESEFRSGDVFFDVGANVGVYSLLASAIHGDGVKVYAFEPSYPSFKQLVRNVFLNGKEEFVFPVPLALGAETLLTQLSLSSLKEGKSFNYLGSIPEAAQAKDESDSRRNQAVLAMSLDEAVKTFKLPQPTLMKVDIDGHELPLVEGAREVFSHPTLRSVHIELDAESAESEKVLKALAEFGLHVEQEDKRGGTARNYRLKRRL